MKTNPANKVSSLVFISSTTPFTRRVSEPDIMTVPLLPCQVNLISNLWPRLPGLLARLGRFLPADRSDSATSVRHALLILQGMKCSTGCACHYRMHVAVSQVLFPDNSFLSSSTPFPELNHVLRLCALRHASFPIVLNQGSLMMKRLMEPTVPNFTPRILPPPPQTKDASQSDFNSGFTNHVSR